MNVKLTKVYREPNLEGGLRGNSVVGNTYEIPQIGSQFCMYASPLETGDLRFIKTSKIIESDILDNIITITTENGSIYTIEILGEDS